jgi:hypothetical protein
MGGIAMTLSRVAPLVSVVSILLNVPALAQMSVQDGAGMLLQPPAAQQGVPPCMRDFVPLKDAAQKKMKILSEGFKHQAPPGELCALFNNFADAEGKMLKFLETNASSCGIPQEVITTSRTNHSKTMEKKQQFCASASFGERRGPGLGEALGMRAVPTPETTSSGKGGAFDTMSGSPLAR